MTSSYLSDFSVPPFRGHSFMKLFLNIVLNIAWDPNIYSSYLRLIIQKDSETKMLLEARQSLLTKFRQKQLPNMGLLFLNLRIRRKFLLEDSLREVSW